MLNSTPFPSDLVPLFQNESSSKNEFYLNENKLAAGGIHFHMNNSVSPKTTRFDIEATPERKNWLEEIRLTVSKHNIFDS